MNKPLLISLAAATLLSSNLSAESMYERIQAMELNIQKMQNELSTLKEQKSVVSSEEDEDEEVTPSDDSSEDEENAETTEDEGDDEEEDEEREPVQDQIDEIQESISELNRATNGNHLKFGVDYRFAIDNLQYKMAAKNPMTGSDTQGNDALMTNRFWLNMDWMATQNLSFRAQLAYNKAFGARSGWNSNYAAMETFDWITNENAYDDTIRVRSAYFLYKDKSLMGADIPWTFSIGRRPSTNGHLINLRDDDGAASPMGHTINVEFDGLSAKFSLEDVIGVNGMYVKLCAGRGGTNANAKLLTVDQSTGVPIVAASPAYSSNGNDIGDIDLVGLIFVPWTNGQYGVATQYYYANNLIDANLDMTNPYQPVFQGMKTVGGMHSFTANFTVNGIGNEISDYLDDTFFFVSGAMSVTDPKADQGMLGSAPGESKTGYSVWAGLQMPSFMTDEGRWGIEYNKGSKYWRSVTYAEDTNIGSKIAARGDAYEAYFTEPLVEDILSLQVRYTYIDYKYSGSNGFFGNDTGSSTLISDTMMVNGANIAPSVVDTAQDIRFYLRYRY